jgi:hypothetical protein
VRGNGKAENWERRKSGKLGKEGQIEKVDTWKKRKIGKPAKRKVEMTPGDD